MYRSPFIKIPLTIDKDGAFMVLANSDEAMKKEQLLAKRESQNRMVVQQMFLVSLLNRFGFDVLLAKPHKRSTATMQCFPVSKIIKGNEVIWNVELMNLNDKSSKDKKTYLDTVTNNMMISLLKQQGIDFKERNTRKGTKEDYIQMKRVESIAVGSAMINLNQSSEIGRRIYILLQTRMQKEGVLVDHNDKEINELLYSSFCSLSTVEPYVEQILYSTCRFNCSSDSSCVY